MTTDITEFTAQKVREIAEQLGISPELLTEAAPVAPTNGIEAIAKRMRSISEVGLRITERLFNQWLIEAAQSGAIPMNFKTLDLNHSLKAEYVSLEDVLSRAYLQAAHGKGAQRHNLSGTTRFEDQRMQTVSLLIDSHKGMEYQVIKKITEGVNLPTHAAQIKELLGAINYIAGMILFLERKNYQKHAGLEDDDTTYPSAEASPTAAPAGTPAEKAWGETVSLVSKFKEIFGRNVTSNLIKLTGVEKLAEVPHSKRNMLHDVCEELIQVCENQRAETPVPEPISADGVQPTPYEFATAMAIFNAAHGALATLALYHCAGVTRIDDVPADKRQPLMTLAATFTSSNDITQD